MDQDLQILRALCQTQDAAKRRSACETLEKRQWAEPEHQIIFEACASLARFGAPISAAALAVQLTRAGFPDVDLDALFDPLPGPAAELTQRVHGDKGSREGIGRERSRLTHRRLKRWLALIDVIGLPVVVVTFIWRWQFTHPKTWIIFPLWIAATFLIHHDTPKTLGWRADNLKPAAREAGVFFGIAIAAVVALDLARGMPRQMMWRAFGEHLWTYFAFCLLQQVALNSLVNNRLISLIPQAWLSSLLAGLVFASAHWPNPVLVPVTLLGGTAMAWIFRRNRNVLTLALGQAIVGSLLAGAFPPAWIHNLRVGPGYYQWK